jgi:dTDP-D-glucose 4,6-dehydratase
MNIKFKWTAVIKINKGLSETIDWYIKNIGYFRSIKNTKHIKRIGLKI